MRSQHDWSHAQVARRAFVGVGIVRQSDQPAGTRALKSRRRQPLPDERSPALWSEEEAFYSLFGFMKVLIMRTLMWRAAKPCEGDLCHTRPTSWVEHSGGCIGTTKIMSVEARRMARTHATRRFTMAKSSVLDFSCALFSCLILAHDKLSAA